MWRRIKHWIINKFLPAWCREECLNEIEHLRTKVNNQAAEISRLNAYIEGMQDALRRQPRITVNGGKPSEHI